MRVIVSYDVSLDDGGKRRLRRVAKVCLNYGLRAQNSLFECEVDWSEFLKFRDLLLKEIDKDLDSLRIYHLGNNWNGKIEHYGTKKITDMKDDTLLI